jgi:2,4-dienoyl-CoA reductase-like NADH-dependent reductase (Old Yellow Enzyme family)
MSRYSHLLAPGQIGSMTLRNRITMSPMASKGTVKATAPGWLM